MLQTAPAVRELTREECLALLPTVPIGRVVFTDRALPAIVPVTFVVDAGHVVLRTGAGSTLSAALRGAVVAFEADEFDRTARNGWSVVVTGQARLVTDPVEAGRLADLDLRPWVGDRANVVLVPIDLVTGRRVGLGPLSAAV